MSAALADQEMVIKTKLGNFLDKIQGANLELADSEASASQLKMSEEGV